MNDLISRKAIMEKLGMAESCEDCENVRGIFCARSNDFVEICEVINDAPTIDAVPVVRCKDCLRFENKLFTYKSDGWCALNEHSVDNDDYCSYGRRRDDE